MDIVGRYEDRLGPTAKDLWVALQGSFWPTAEVYGYCGQVLRSRLIQHINKDLCGS
jgi:hypothetical protein